MYLPDPPTKITCNNGETNGTTAPAAGPDVDEGDRDEEGSQDTDDSVHTQIEVLFPMVEKDVLWEVVPPSTTH